MILSFRDGRAEAAGPRLRAYDDLEAKPGDRELKATIELAERHYAQAPEFE
jgi:hypothetical protein